MAVTHMETFVGWVVVLVKIGAHKNGEVMKVYKRKKEKNK